jgi:ribosome-associated translation inhibitor RaiA
VQIQINTDRNIEGNATLNEKIDATLRQGLDRFLDRITRLEVHLSDEDGSAKSKSDDKRCRLEARLAGVQPILVSHEAPSVDLAVDGALTKLERALDTVVGKLRGR